MIHGQSVEVLAAIEKSETYKKKVSFLRSNLNEVLDLADRAKNDPTDAALEYLEKSKTILMFHGEFHSLLNTRKYILEKHLSLGNLDTLISDMQLTGQLIEKNIKSSVAWNHRIWLYRKLYSNYTCEDVEGLLGKELTFIRKIAMKDTRNYNLWNHRRKVMRIHGILYGADSLQMIKEMIKSNPYNFSAWHEYLLHVENAIKSDGESWVDIKELVEYVFAKTEELLFTDPSSQVPYAVYNNILRILLNHREHIERNSKNIDVSSYVELVFQILDDTKEVILGDDLFDNEVCIMYIEKLEDDLNQLLLRLGIDRFPLSK